MPRLPENLKLPIYKTLEGEMPVKDFEEWLYASDELPKSVSQDDCLELISVIVNKEAARYDLWKLLSEHIDLGEFETYKILKLLYEARLKNESLPDIL